MTPRAKYQIGTAILGVAVLMLIFELLEMTESIPRYVEPRELNIVAVIFLVIASAMRRRARVDMAGTNTPPPTA